MVKSNERIKLGFANGVLISGDLDLDRNPEHAPIAVLPSGINLEDIIILKIR